MTIDETSQLDSTVFHGMLGRGEPNRADRIQIGKWQKKLGALDAAMDGGPH